MNRAEVQYCSGCCNYCKLLVFAAELTQAQTLCSVFMLHRGRADPEVAVKMYCSEDVQLQTVTCPLVQKQAQSASAQLPACSLQFLHFHTQLSVAEA